MSDDKELRGKDLENITGGKQAKKYAADQRQNPSVSGTPGQGSEEFRAAKLESDKREL